AGSDYAGIGATVLTFTPGQTSKTITVNVAGDTNIDGDETVNVNLSGQSANAAIGDNLGVGTITNADSAVSPSITINNVTKAEGNAGTTAFTFDVLLSAAAANNVTVSYNTSDGTATTVGNDYTGIGITVLTFTPGQTSKTITVNVAGDTN